MIYSAATTALPMIKALGPLDRGKVEMYLGIARSGYGGCVKPLSASWPN